ncbi:hypothetical protein AL755_03060 (plasmid) [Arthrobacter sp. ERGS1:01]|uniref:hypothetical protein n=1 Tax=Arthrobacter sp. ERGS1:01 TaxID=1704044 RepID=UPI0006B48E47|nr:hypothetical protein [Arthrobacter sp. ERGS1:01]ALE04622.1 hypothetical protein AL755_03060 [Arthrobacter sp. ERGS1:01]
MSDMKRMIHQAQNLGTAGVRHTLDNPSAVLDTVTKWGRTRLDERKAPQVVAGIFDTVADKAMFSRQTRKLAKKALKHAARELRRRSPSLKRKKKAWLLWGLFMAATVVGTILIVRTLRDRLYQEALGVVENPPAPVDDPVETPVQEDPGPGSL